ncbi:MAG: hypothetical protein QXP42_03840 [Candidatus Micrarchaeia archaeon]
MRVEAKLIVNDVPGALLKAIEPISAHGGNIISVAHIRTRKSGKEVPLLIYFEIKDMESLDAIKSGFKKNRVKLTEMKLDGHRFLKRRSFYIMLLGHVMETDARDTLDRLHGEGAQISDFSVSITSPELPSAALLKINVDERKCEDILETMRKTCKEKNLLCIREI